MPDDSGKHRTSGRSELLPVLAIVLFGALLLGVAVFWDGGAGDTATARDTSSSSAQAAPPSDGTRPRNDRDERAVDGELIEPLTSQAADPLEGVEEIRRSAEAQVKKVNQAEVTFNIASMNMLGHGYTAPGGSRAHWPDSPWRSAQVVGYMRKYKNSIVGLQEARTNQLAAVTNATGYDAWPRGKYPDNSIVWDTTQFEMVAGEQIYVPFNGANRGQPVIRFRHKASKREFYVINMHTQAGKSGGDKARRNSGFSTLVAKVKQLQSEKIPIFVVGDMNDRANFYCRVVPPTGLVASHGGGGTCSTPPKLWYVDWVLGWGNVSFSNYHDDRSAIDRRVSDHPYISATATMKGTA